LDITDRYPNIFFAVGSHPLNKDSVDHFTRDELLTLSSHPKMVGIGETGLDYFYSSENTKQQKENFKLHIAVARECALPLIVHSRSADNDMSQILQEEYKAGHFACVLHCFSSGVALANAAIDLGFYLSISGIATFPKSSALREIFSCCPLNRLLVETDSPYLAPPPFRGKRNEPAHVAVTTKVISEYLNISEASFRQQTTDNFNRLFTKTEQ
jgi:TatD DNase family protein